jgi:flagellar biogenesis protein FliO
MDRRFRRAIALLLFILLLAPLGAQEAAPSVVETPGKGVEARPPARTRTVGDVLGEMVEQEATKVDSSTVESEPQKPSETGSVESSVPTSPEVRSLESDARGGDLDLPERRVPGESWATEGQVGRSTFFDKLINVCWSLALVSFLVWGSAKLAQRFGVKNLPLGGAESLIEIIEKKRLSPGRTIMVMRVGPKVLVVAATEKGYETLTEFDSEDFRQYQDSSKMVQSEDSKKAVGGAASTPGEIARHYFSIIPGTGAKK